MISCPHKGCKGTVTYRFNLPTCSEHGVIGAGPKIPQTEKPKPKRKTRSAR